EHWWVTINASARSCGRKLRLEVGGCGDFLRQLRHQEPGNPEPNRRARSKCLGSVAYRPICQFWSESIQRMGGGNPDSDLWRIKNGCTAKRYSDLQRPVTTGL